MKTVILCGGEGTRLNELTESIPKPLVEIGGKPILWHVMKIYARHGFNRFVLCLGYKGNLIEDYFGKNREPGWEIVFADTGLKTNTGGRIKKIEKHIDDDLFFATYGDGLADIDLKKLLDYHKQKGMTTTVTCVNPVSQFGVIDTDENDLIVRFREKPRVHQWINGGFFVFNKAIFNVLTEEDVLERRPFELLAEKKEIAAYKFKGFWDCMDTFKDMQLLNNLWNENKAPWKVWS
ncbi:MAG: NTP transferase domain-containing protein [Deltaproteobacteria bacterium]|nr:NTP transferase domain-containing protein [Deltaproteobacteria bacterium]MBI4224570.1 NTP transferase domain-containing protein [Deltaproteobacteria bacterium]